MKLNIEIRAGESGQDAKLLVEDQAETATRRDHGVFLND